MAGMVCTITYKGWSTIKTVTFTWLSDDAAGTASGTTKPISGVILRAVTDPGETAPTDDYDIVVNDANGVDVMAAALADRDTANTEQVIPAVGPAVSGPLTMEVSAAGNAKEGVLVLYYR